MTPLLQASGLSMGGRLQPMDLQVAAEADGRHVKLMISARAALEQKDFELARPAGAPVRDPDARSAPSPRAGAPGRKQVLRRMT